MKKYCVKNISVKTFIKYCVKNFSVKKLKKYCVKNLSVKRFKKNIALQIYDSIGVSLIKSARSKNTAFLYRKQNSN